MFDSATIIAALQFVYQIYRDRRLAPQADALQRARVKVQQHLKEGGEPSKARTIAAETLKASLTPEEFCSVQAELDAHLTLPTPPNLTSFKYWDALREYVQGLQSIAAMYQVFRLRGHLYERNLYFLELPTTGLALIPQAETASIIRSDGMSRSVVNRVGAILMSDGKIEMPLFVRVEGTRQEDDPAGYGMGATETIRAAYNVELGDEQNRLRFMVRRNTTVFKNHVRLLRATDLHEIFKHLTDDVLGYLADVQTDEREFHARVEPLLLSLQRAIKASD